MVKISKIQNVLVVNWGDALEQFLFWKKAQGLSEQTINDYKQQVQLFFKRYLDSQLSIEELKHDLFHYLGQENIKLPCACTHMHALHFIRFTCGKIDVKERKIQLGA